MAEAISRADIPPGLRCVALEVRDSGFFENPNALQSDFMRLVNASRRVVEAGLRDATERDAIVFVLVAVSQLNILQIASPVQFPDWVPVVGGCECVFSVEQLLETADGPFDSPEARIGHMTRSLFEVDEALTATLVRELDAGADRCSPFLDRVESILKGSVGDSADRLSAAQRSLDGVTSPESYRPSLGKPVTPVAWIGRMVQDQSPKELPKAGAELLRALGIVDGREASLRQSLPAILFRSSFAAEDALAPLGANIMCTIYLAFQYTSAAAHADRYPRQVLATLHATSDELIKSLMSVTRILRQDCFGA